MLVPLFYDKYAGTHQYNNQITKGMDVETLEDSDAYYKLYGNDAIDAFNNTFIDFPMIKIPPIDMNIYGIEFYQKHIGDTLSESYLIVRIDTKKIENILNNKSDTKTGNSKVPNQDFLINCCRSHHRYEKGTQEKNLSMTRDQFNETRIEKVIDRVMKAVEYEDEEPIDDPEEISKDLFVYQKCSIKWMINKELHPFQLQYNISEEVVLNNVCVDIKSQCIDLTNNRPSITLKGGAIIDEVGLGKTLQITTLSVINPPDQFNLVQDNWFRSRATLVICPSHLCGQWKQELLDTISKKFNPDIITILNKTQFNTIRYQELLNADFVIISFNFLDNSSFSKEWAPIANYQRSPSFHNNVAQEEFDKKRQNLMKDSIASLLSTKPILPVIHWHRLVVDEFHEVYTNKKYLYVRNILPHFYSTYRWCMTATPFCNKDNLYHIVAFLSGYQCISKYIFESDVVVNYLAEHVFRRNTKKSIENEHTLPPINEKVLWLKFSPTERIMYNAYLADPNNDKFSVYLRQLCCHPKLADETKMILSNCKTLEDIEQVMVSHYEKQISIEEEKVNHLNNRIVQIDTKIRRINRRQKRNHLKRLGKLPDPLPEELMDTENELETDLKSDFELDDINVIRLMDLLKADNDNNYDNDDDVEIDKLKKLSIVKNLEDAKMNINSKLIDAKKILKGKESTCNFYKNVVAKIRKTAKVINKDDEFNPLSYYSKQSQNDDDEECIICMGEIPEDDVGVTSCGHIFCYQCIKIMTNKSKKCPICSRFLGSKDVWMLNYQKPIKEEKKEEKDIIKEELINNVGTKLANLILYIKENDKHTIIFSQWDDLLRKVGHILKEYGIKIAFCRGNVFQRDKAIREFNEDDGIKIIMLSSDKAASGSNLTKAQQIILLDPVYGSYKFRKDIETQAIGLSHRLGQKNQITVIRFIIQDSVESEIYNANVEEDATVGNDNK